ncbi:hypothetical protein ACC720_38615, partial [Rhizobium ruizarguesonis]
MAFFIAGNLLCALASYYWLLMIARVVTALCHGDGHVARQVSLGFKCRHAPQAGCSDRLAERIIRHVARGIDYVQAGRGRIRR